MRVEIFIILLFYFFICIQTYTIPDENEQTIMNIYYENNGKYTTKNSTTRDENAIAYAIYNKSYERIGWDFLAISSYEKNDSKYKDEDKAYAMGYLEGVLTKNRIYSFFINVKHHFFSDKNLKIPDNLKQFFKKNILYMEEMSLKNKDTDIYWENVYYIYKQLKGLYDGYMSVAEKEKQIDFDDFLLLPGLPDSLEALYYKDTKNRPNFIKMTNEEIKRFTLLNSHCSALIKLADDYSDIWFGHNTWFIYNAMIRLFKEYRFISNKNNLKSKTVAFSSYPASLFSQDDFYYVDSNLLVMETTNSIFNQTLYDLLKPESLLTWVRVILANRLASSAEEWTNIFKKENSGTYNDQYMILDLNKINLTEKKIPEKSLMIIEQIPGETDINDVTEILKKGYWPSYNIPYSDNIYEKSGFTYLLKERNYLFPYYDYKNCSRANIFKREHKKIKTNDDFKNLMRYNNYENEEFSYKDPTLTIACRADLGKNKQCFGATDVKFVSVKELLEGKKNIHIISGPTNVQYPTFSWENTTCDKESPENWHHEGVVNTWNFPWVDYKIQLLDKNDSSKEDDDSSKEEDTSKGKDSTPDNSSSQNDNSGNNQQGKDIKMIIIISCVFGGIILIIIMITIIIAVKNKNSYEKLKKEVNKISFSDENKNNEQGEDLLV